MSENEEKTDKYSDRQCPKCGSWMSSFTSTKYDMTGVEGDDDVHLIEGFECPHCDYWENA